MTDTPAKVSLLNRFLNCIERMGNKLPHITMLFIYALIVTMLVSLCLSFINFDYVHPNTGEKIKILNMFAPDNLLSLIVSSVKNFMGFPPLGITIVATLGIGIAEG
jgi:aminobenzoyl-glutamate transport protein